MGFFDRLIPDEWVPVREFAEPASNPDDELWWTPGVIPRQYVIARSDKAAVLVTNVTVHREAFTFVLDARIRRPKKGRSYRSYSPDWEPAADEMTVELAELPDDVLRFGVQFPDGQQVTNLDPPRFWRRSTHEPTPSCGLDVYDQGEDGFRYHWTCRAWPVPLTGDLTFVCEWPGFDVPEAHLAVPAADFREALARTKPIWPSWRSTPQAESP